MQTVLLVDDDAPLLRAYQRTVGKKRLALVASCSQEALSVAHREPIDLAVVDLVLHGESGIDLVRELAKVQPHAFIIVMSSLLSADSTRRAFLAGAYDCIEKPLNWPIVFASVEQGMSIPSRPNEVPRHEQIKRECYAKLVEANGGNVTKSAALAGVDRRTFQRILRGGSIVSDPGATTRDTDDEAD